MSDTTAGRIVAEARCWIGTPYRHGASLQGVGCDCLGLVRGVWRAILGPEPAAAGPYSPDWAEAAGAERLRDAARRWLVEIEPPTAAAGDVLLFRWKEGLPAKHLAIVSGPGRMIHAHDGACVAEVAFGVWRRRLAHAFRFPAAAEHTPEIQDPVP
jgi:NlpC/P60 family putative phage cell wall peptidase